MAIRFRSHLRFAPGSGMAQWCYNQMQVRMGMAFHLREGTPAQERSVNKADIVTTGPQSGRREVYDCDVLWPDDRQDLADDTIAQFTTLGPWMRADEPDDGDRSWMDSHVCNHDQDPPQPCTNVTWSWSL